jgi:cytochrome c-type biogenesis protein CcmE
VSGLVLKGTKSWNSQTNELHFRITDLQGHEFAVSYKGIPPDLFKESQGVVVEGKLYPDWNKKLITADLLMVKHSEVYDTKKEHSNMREAKLLDSILKKEATNL